MDYRDVQGSIATIQYIAPEKVEGKTDKYFISRRALKEVGACLPVCWHDIGDFNNAKIIGVTEGYSDAATCHEAKGYPIAVAGGASNVPKVCNALKELHPTAHIIHIADRGQAGDKAIQDAGCDWTRPTEHNDFNELYQVEGKQTVVDQFDSNLTSFVSIKNQSDFQDVPHGYVCSKHGVYSLDQGKDDKPKKIPITSKPIIVKAISRSESGENWGVLVWWLDADNKQHERAIPKKLFHSRGTEISQLLADNGLPIVIGKENALLNYLGSFDIAKRLVAASCTGWQDNAFILPGRSIREPKGSRIVFQPSGFNSIPKAIRTSGNFEAWQIGIAHASSMVRFFICASLAAPVRYKVSIEAGGFHAFNLTSRGKTTMLQAAASVWGNGSDPAITGGDGAYIQRWNATGNALEAVAECFNDLPMIVDEIGEGDAKEFGKTIYRIISGTGKSRLKDTANLKDNRSWRISLLSAGELAVSDFIGTSGSQIKGGQLVRLLDLDLSSTEPLFNCAEEADAMKVLFANHFGHAGIEFIKRVDDLTTGWKEFDTSQIGEASEPIASRALKRFALVAYTGMIAARAGILPWTEDQILGSAKTAYSAWLSRINITSDIDRGIESVIDFILAHESRFESLSSEITPHNRAGWHRDDMYHFTPSAFNEACNGVDPANVKRELEKRKLLHLNKDKGFNSNITVGGKTVSVVSVKSQVISGPLKNSGNGGNGGNPPVTTRVSGNTTHVGEVVTVVTQGPERAQPVTTNTTHANKVVTAAAPENTGSIPPLPPIPPQSSECNVPQEELTPHKNGVLI